MSDILIDDFTSLIRFSDEAYPRSFYQVRMENPNTTFPYPIRADILEAFDHGPVLDGEKPDYNKNTSYLGEEKPVKKDDGNWYKTWVVKQYTQEQLDQNLSTAKENTLAQVGFVIEADRASGVDYEYNGDIKPISVSPDTMSFMLSMKTLAKDAEDSETFKFMFDDYTVVDFTKTEFLAFLNNVFNSLYQLNVNYWNYVKSVKETTLIENLPEIPLTFKGE